MKPKKLNINKSYEMKVNIANSDELKENITFTSLRRVKYINSN